MTLSTYFGLCAAGVLVLAQSVAMAQSAVANYPDKPIRLISPFPPGGPTDLIARLVGQRLTDTWGQQIVVDNRSGANGIIGQDLVAKARPDGYTLMVNSTGYSINPSMYKLPFDTNRDFLPITQVVSMWQMLVVHPDVPAKSVGELVALAKAKPATLNYSTFGTGSIAHLAAELFKLQAGGIQITHVPYKGVPQAFADLFAGQVQMMLPTLGSIMPHYKAGRVRGLAVTSRQRLPFLADIPTMIEAGIPDYEAVSWIGLFFPAGVPQPIVSKVHGEVTRILATPEVKSSLETQGYVLVGNSPADFKKFINLEMEKYARVVKAAGMKVD